MLKEQGGEFTVTVDQMKPSMYYPNGVAHLYNSDYNDLGDAEWEIFLTAFHGTEGLSHLPKEYQDSYNKFRSQLVIAGLTKNSYDPDWDYSKEPFNYIEREDGFLTFTGVYMDVDHVNKTAMAKIRFDGLCMTESLSVHYVMSLDNVFN